MDDWQQLEDLQFRCASMRTHEGVMSTTARLEVDKSTAEATEGSGEAPYEDHDEDNQGVPEDG
eukprot:3722506-Prorocentrum_lima.AAC.1